MSPESIAAVRAAEAAFQEELKELMDQHRAALGGDFWVVHAVLESVGTRAIDLLQELGRSVEGERAQQHLDQLIVALAVHVATARSVPQ